MYNLIGIYREWDGSLSQIFDYFIALYFYLWNQFGVIGVAVAIFIIIVIGMRSKDFGHFFSLVSASMVRSIGGVVGFFGGVIQQLTLFFLGNAAQAVVREYFSKFDGLLGNWADNMKNKKKKDS